MKQVYKQSSGYQSGSMLIEALIALLVVGVGIFGVIKLNTVTLLGTGESKTRAEALQLAQRSIESLRNYSLGAGCTTAQTLSSTATGVNASYNLATVISDVTAESEAVTVHVGWDGVSNAVNSASDKKVVLTSSIPCVSPGTSALVGGNATALNGGTVKTPTGSAKVGGRTNATCPTGCIQTVAAPTGAATDNLKVYTTGNLVELVDAANNVLLTIEDGSAFSTISGRVYIETGNSGTPIVNPQNGTAATSDDNVFILSSDASYCSRVFLTDTTLTPVPSSGTAKYKYFDYNCYVSKGWWGNIGVVRLDNPNTSHRVCVGDEATAAMADTSIFSRKAAMNIYRGYRGYKKTGQGPDSDPSQFDTVGVGYANISGVVSSTYAAVSYGKSSLRSSETHHDFLITSINGQGTCDGSGNMHLVADNGTTVPGSTASNQFTNNQGKYFCMTNQCPTSLTQSGTTQTTVVHGTITKNAGAVLTGIDPADCNVAPVFTDNGSNYSYSCTKVWTGFAGSSWQGGVTFLTAGTGNVSTICSNSTGSTPTVIPSGNSVASTVNSKLASVNPNSLSFTDVGLTVTDITINFDTFAASCPSLGTPAPSWPSATSNMMQNLTWPAIVTITPNTTVTYKVKTCELSGNNPSCVPNSSTTQSSTTLTPTAYSGNVKGRCYSVIATNGTDADSTESGIKCVKGSFNFY